MSWAATMAAPAATRAMEYFILMRGDVGGSISD